MNRRSFLQTLTAVIAAPLAVAAAVSSTTVTVAPGAGLAFHKDAFAAVWAPVDKATVEFRVQQPCRFDILYGWATVRPELACRLVGG